MAGCSVGAASMLLAGIMEMKHVDTYIDLTQISDEQLLTHPVFIHNFVMCILSILDMTMYLIQTWILFDHYRWIRRKGRISGEPADADVSDSSADADITGSVEPTRVETSGESKGKEQPGELDPIPSLEKFPSYTVMSGYEELYSVGSDLVHIDKNGQHHETVAHKVLRTDFAMLTMGTFGGYLIILIGLFAGNVMGTPVNRRVDLFFSLVGCALFIATGALNIEHFQRIHQARSFRDTGMAKGSISIIEGIFFLVDAFLTFRGEA
ncbi:hypothetical protein KM043_012103 [Ampulex compressa]|nr:hypothetical protein KM043_012103 [Ampulex compressa]